MKVWLARLKNENTGVTYATKPAKPKLGEGEAGFVGFVASSLAPFEQFDKTRNYVHAQTQAVNDEQALVSDPDRWGWPYSTAMNTREIEVFMARMVRFTERGVSHDAAELVAGKLVIRDREQDERRYCLECACLRGADLWHCGNWQRAQVPRTGIPRDFVMQLQRCSGFR